MREITRQTINVQFDSGTMPIEEVICDCSDCLHKPCCRDFCVPLTPYEARILPEESEKLRNGFHYLAKKADGSCVMLQADGRCLIWSERPAACREYSCKGDQRVR